LLRDAGGHNVADAQEKAPGLAQIVALDECDPITSTRRSASDFCRNVALGALGFSTTLQDLFSKAAAESRIRAGTLSRMSSGSKRELSWR